MLGKISHSALPEILTRNVAEYYLSQARTERGKGHLDAALTLYDQLKETLKSLGSVKEALRKAQDPHTLADETLRAMMADAYFERGEVLKGLNLFAKARSSYLKAEIWGHDEAKQHHVEASQPPPSSNKSASVRTAAPTSMSVEEKSDLVDYLFEKALLTLSSLEVPNKPTLFLVYAHDNPAHGKAEASTSKYLIDKLSNLRGVNLYSDQTPMGQAYSSSAENLKGEGKLEDILTNQLCLLPARLIKEVEPVDKVVVCCSQVLGNYLKDWSDYKKFYEELREAYGEDREAYLKDGGQKGPAAIREVVRKFSQEEKYKAGFHHVLTEMAFLEIRAEHLNDQHGIIPVSLTSNSYDQCLAYFIPATTVRMEDIPRFEEQAQAGREVYANQSRHGVLFKVIERLLVDSDEAKTFLSKFWYGHSDFIFRLKSESKFGKLEFAKLLDGIFDGIRTALQSQLASTVQQQHQQLRVLNTDPRSALKEHYFAALKQDKAFGQTLQLYVEPRGKASLDGEIEIFNLLPQVQALLNDKQVILLTGDSGAGKTTFNRRLEKHLWDNKKADDDAIPLFISLASIDKPEDDLIAKALKKSGLSDFQIQKLKKEKQRFVFILDGYDEIRQTQNLYLSNAINQPDGWQGQMVISCRSEYLSQDYRSRFQPNPNLQDQDTLFQEIVVEPFSKEERNQYLEEYVKHNPTEWAAQQYQKALEEPHLKALASNPFLLRVVLEALPYVGKKRKAPTAIQLRLDLYNQFVRQWFERNQQRLSTQNLTGTQREIFRALCDDDFVQHGIGFVKDLAVHFYTENAGNPVVEYSLYKDKGNWKDAFFGREEEKQPLQEAWPLSRSGNQYRFIHKSLLEYFVAQALFDSFDECMALGTRRRGSNASVYSFENQAVLPGRTLRELSLAPKHWVNDLGVVRLLAERVEQETPFKKQLLAIIERSKTDARVRQVAANAITILVKAGVQFNGANLKGIQIPGADLSEGVFDSAQLQRADLRKTNLRAIWLRNANLSGAQMAAVQFGEWPYLQEENHVYSCAYSPDEKTFAVGLTGGNINVYATSNWEKIHTLLTRPYSAYSFYSPCSFYSVTYSPNGEQIASGDGDYTVRLWDVETGACRHTLSGHTDDVLSVVYSPTGDQIASGSGDCTVRLWDAYSGQLRHTLSGHTHRVTSVAYSPSGEQIASGSWDNTVRLWDAHSGQLRHTLEGHTSTVWSVTYAPSGEQIASGSGDYTVRLWDVETGAARYTLSGHTDPVTSVTYSPSGEQVASGSDDKTVRLWDTKSGQLRDTLIGHTDRIASVTYSPSGEQIASGGWDKTVRLWDAQSRQLRPNLSGHEAVDSVAYSFSGQQIASVVRYVVQLRDAHSGQVLHTLSGHNDYVNHAMYSPNGEQIASGSRDCTVRLWDTRSGQLRRTLSGHTGHVLSVAYSPSGEQIASASTDRTVRLWDTKTGEHRHTLDGHTREVYSVVYSPNGQQIVSGSRDNTVRLWDAYSGQLRHTLSGHTGEITSVTYSPNGEQIASSSGENMVLLWDAYSGQLHHTLIGHTSHIWRVAYSPSGEQVASGSWDHTVRLWDAYSGQLRHTLSGHTNWVSSVAYSPSGDQIASGSDDNTVRLWDTHSGQCRAVIQGFSERIHSLAWKVTPNGNYLVTGSYDKSVRQWYMIEENGQVQVRLCWSSTHTMLAVTDASIQDVQGLSRMNQRLLEQREAGLLKKTEDSTVVSFIDGVQGLSGLDKRLLEQRGAASPEKTEDSIVSCEEDSAPTKHPVSKNTFLKGFAKKKIFG
ncbi:NACHT domain-containing protein [Mycoavidus sp. HKI]|uniref:WD40 domain-containing protein n=1 Tax=Mycoavidus sp. HKI TaxID=2840467 RepID=UPI001CBBF496|nr:NACHT domain-containing protein [Mycoavidus sp. HKI]UAW64895.1 NACHT domain-containing protein [Mycoavidus sp. HKI]